MILTTRVCVTPSMLVLVFTESGVAGSIRPVLMFFISGLLALMQSGSVSQVFVFEPTAFVTKVLVWKSVLMRKRSLQPRRTLRVMDVQYRVSDEQHGNSDRNQGKTSHVE